VQFEAIGLHLRRSDPLPTFLKVRAELQIEELTMSKSAPAAALYAGSTSSKQFSDNTRPPTAPPKPPHQQQQQGASGPPSGGLPRRGKRGGRRNGGGSNSFSGPPGGSGSGGRAGPNFSSNGGYPYGQGNGSSMPFPWPSYQHPWSGSFNVWSGPRGMTPARSPASGPVQAPHAFMVGSPGQWASHWGVQTPTPPMAPLLTALTAAARISRPWRLNSRRFTYSSLPNMTGTLAPAPPIMLH
jgi:hypothetical protein